jgi:CxxC-x17-CxxC domain-containing protein
MNNFRKASLGGKERRTEFIGGRPQSDANYDPKKRFDKKPRHEIRGGFSGGDNRGGGKREVELFKTICTTCGKSTEVPFRPDGSKPVLCRDCFSNKSEDRGVFEKRDRFASERPQRKPERDFGVARPDNGDYKVLKELDNKLNEILSILKVVPVKEEKGEIPETKEVKVKKTAVKKVAKK